MQGIIFALFGEEYKEAGAVLSRCMPYQVVPVLMSSPERSPLQSCETWLYVLDSSKMDQSKKERVVTFNFFVEEKAKNGICLLHIMNSKLPAFGVRIHESR